jgi:hypothetical protein
VVYILKKIGKYMSYFGNDNPKNSMGELEVAEVTPVVQITAQYGLLPTIFHVEDSSGSGSTSAENSMFISSTGNDSSGLATILTQTQINIKAGQGGMIIADAMFDTPGIDSRMSVGFINAEDSFVFGYDGDIFGVSHMYLGKDELQTLTILSSGTGTANITINDVVYSVNLTPGDESHNAYEIAKQLTEQVQNYNIHSNGSTVLAQSVISREQGLFAFQGSTATATWNQEVAGVEPQRDFTPQSDWNGINADYLDTSKLNNYKIVFNGNVKFYIQNPDTSDFDLVHTIKFLNSSVNPHTGNPTFRGGWLAGNTGSILNKTISGSKLGMFLQGKAVKTDFIRAAVHTAPTIGTTETTVLILRNRYDFNNRVNRSNLFPRFLSFSTDTNKSMIFNVYVNPIFQGDVIYEYIDKKLSIVEVATNEVEIINTGGFISSTATSFGSNAQINLIDTNLNFEPGTTFVVTAQVSSGSPSEATASVNWVEDF